MILYFNIILYQFDHDENGNRGSETPGLNLYAKLSKNWNIGQNFKFINFIKYFAKNSLPTWISREEKQDQ